MERLLPLARQSQVTLATGDLLEVLIRGDPRYLGQMLTNLIENGIKYSSGIGKRVYAIAWIRRAHDGKKDLHRAQNRAAVGWACPLRSG